MMRRMLVLAGLLSVFTHTGALAQVRGAPTRVDTTVKARPDTARRDSTRADSASSRELVKWNEPDSVMQSLMTRPGYTPTKYQGDRAVFDARTHTLELEGNKAAVNREQTVLVGDSITYSDSTKLIVARGDTVILRDPEQQAADVIARGQMAYNLELHRGVVTNIATQIAETGQNWFVNGRTAAFVSDTTRGRETAFYVRNGSITSCDDSIPDYHFQAKEIKMVSKHIMVARPAVLYIGEVPVMWLPFIFQDMRSGRRSGILTPRFGLSELFRNSPSYRRHLENLGYYFAISDYMDAQFALDWRSGARPSENDPGWTRYNADMQYRWLDRFVTGRFAISYLDQRDGSSNTAINWTHSQDFSQSTHFRTNVNYVTNTFVQRNTSFNPAQVLATISSSANYDTKIGPATLALGGSMSQHPGRTEVERNFPNFSLTVPTLSPVPWLDWTPALTFDTDQTLDADQGGEFPYRYFTGPTGQPDSVKNKVNIRNTRSSFTTPLRLGGFTWSNSFSLIDRESNQPTTIPVRDVADSSIHTPTVFARTFSTEIDWQTGITLPSFLQSSLKLTPSVAFSNVDSRGFWIRTEQNGVFVHQSKRPIFQLSASPTLFALFPGFGPVSRFRHSISPILSYNYAPTGDISDAYLRALNISRPGYLGALAQNRLTLGFSHVLEAKLRSSDTSSTAEPQKIKILSMNVTPLSYDFERARKTGRSGWVTDEISSDFLTDLIPGFRGNIRYSLYQGDVLSDTARFKPYFEGIDGGVTLNSQSGIFGAITRVFGRAVPQRNPQIERIEQSGDDALANAVASTPVAGIQARNKQYSIPPSQGWSATLQYTYSRQRPPTGNGIIIESSPELRCAAVESNPIVFEDCVQRESALVNGGLPPGTSTSGTPFIRVPPRNNLQSSMNFHLTPSWAGTWTTNYDFEAHKFGSHTVALQRDLHDWKAIFGFTQAPNGNFAFNFFIALTAEPDLKFNYDKSTYRPVTR